MEKNIILSIIIVSYNCYDYLSNTIDSICRYNDLGSQIEVIIVDNGSDNTYKRINKNFPFNVIAFKNANNGFGEGNNRGADIARGEYLLFLNPDTELVEPVFKKVVSIFENNPRIGSVGVKLIDKEGIQGPTFNLRFRFGLLRTLMSRIFIKLDLYLQSMMYTSGADLFIRSELFNRIGGFDENLFMYCEESDVSNRINEAGYKTFYYDKLSILHYEGKTQNSNLSSTYFRELDSWVYYCQKYGINFQKEFKKELFYCKFKCIILKILRKKDVSDQYDKIIEKCKNYYKLGL